MNTVQEFSLELVCDGNTVSGEIKTSRCCPGECIAGPNQKDL